MITPAFDMMVALGSWRGFFDTPYRQQAETTGLGTSDSTPDSL